VEKSRFLIDKASALYEMLWGLDKNSSLCPIAQSTAFTDNSVAHTGEKDFPWGTI